MRNLQATAGEKIRPVVDRKPQKTGQPKGEESSITTAMLEYLCSAQRTGRFRQCALEMDVEYLRWLLKSRISSGTP